MTGGFSGRDRFGRDEPRVLGYRARQTARRLGLTEDAVTNAPQACPRDDGCGPPARFVTVTARHRRQIARLVPVRANGQPAWGEGRRDAATGTLHLGGVEVITLAGDRISEIARFETTLAPHFGLPRTLS